MANAKKRKKKPAASQTEKDLARLHPQITDRWSQVAAWTEGDCPHDWAPRTDKERDWARFIQRVRNAETKRSICAACAPNLLIQGLDTSYDEVRFGENRKSLPEVLQVLASAMRLTKKGAATAKSYADKMRENKSSMAIYPNDLAALCAEKFNIIRHAVETALTPEQRGECKAKQVYEEHGIVGPLTRWRILSDSFLESIEDQPDFHRQNLAERWEHERIILGQEEGGLANVSVIKDIRDAKAEIEKAPPPGHSPASGPPRSVSRSLSDTRRRAGKKSVKIKSRADRDLIAKEFRICRKKGYDTNHSAAVEVSKRIERGSLKVSAACRVSPPSIDTIKRYAKARK
ncbi:MAG: hypothetical protein HN341_08375 [Verrucomicrobia bacterium]|jgi:hypothetical protein|nr:hypothetical protein [Verrucomicrobiota bacterium]